MRSRKEKYEKFALKFKKGEKVSSKLKEISEML